MKADNRDRQMAELALQILPKVQLAGSDVPAFVAVNNWLNEIKDSRDSALARGAPSDIATPAPPDIATPAPPDIATPAPPEFSHSRRPIPEALQAPPMQDETNG